jgi:hypothetical protein
MRCPRFLALAALCAAVSIALPAQATLLDATSRGATTGSLVSNSAGQAGGNYFTGFAPLPFGENRSFFVFDLAGVAGTITSATLQLDVGPFGNELQGTRTLNIFGIPSGDPATLMAGGTSGAIFADLASGTLYGSVSVDFTTSGTLDIALDGAALAALNGAEGGLIGFAGALSGFTTPSADGIFSSTSGVRHPGTGDAPAVGRRRPRAGARATPPSTLRLKSTGAMAEAGRGSARRRRA